MSWTTLVPVLGVWAVAVVSPGPDFLVVLRYAAGRSRRSGLRVAAGVVTGIAAWATAGLLGVTVLVTRFDGVYTALRVAGALFLIGFGLATLRSARRPDPARAVDPAPVGRAAGGVGEWRTGLLTNLANPKALVFFGALFASVLPRDAGLADKALILAAMVAMALGWFGAVAALASTPVVTAGYRRARRALDAVTGGLFVGFGALLIPR
ncbi:MAG TPA: LysE family transporter [Pilimelia sp.]|nr:LysE family transporter [Pilimelia sp.]